MYTRRGLLKQAGAATGAILAGGPARFSILSAAALKTDIRVKDVTLAYEEYKYRTPIKFGGHVVDRASILNVNCLVEIRGRFLLNQRRVEVARVDRHQPVLCHQQDRHHANRQHSETHVHAFAISAALLWIRLIASAI
jgi:hypothetical protein